ncbi:hypothetical protein S1OALGB6SA_1693 [Olavius algarvensis spirochete endosymbiont]|nr:hypothetical protein S1OALGB6SA_1693 [Olavius algarvensis spirochete endosymbiont]
MGRILRYTGCVLAAAGVRRQVSNLVIDSTSAFLHIEAWGEESRNMEAMRALFQ